MVVAAEDHEPQLSPANGFVEGGCNGNSTHAVGIENPRLGADHKAILLGLLDPVQVVLHLNLNVFGRFGGQGAQHVGGDAVGGAQVVGGAAGADPAEGTKSVVKAHRAEDVLNVARVAEVQAVVGQNVGTGSAGFQQKGVAVVKEVHTAGMQRVDGSHVTAQRRLDFSAEALGILSH